MDRRDFLKGSALAGTAGLALDACTPGSDQLIPLLVPEEPFVPGEEIFAASTCFECSAGCGILVRKIDGRLVKVEGNPAHPLSRGGVCARGQALPQAMYHPDRIRTPLVREGGQLREASWEEALERVAKELSSAEVGFVTGETRGQRRAMVARLLESLPSSRHFVHEPFCTTTLVRASQLTTGRSSLPGTDVANAGYIVSFGAEILESHLSPVGFARGLAEMRHGRAGRRGKFVMVGPRMSLTAANADEWIPVSPGTELELALALSFVLLSEGRYDEDFARTSTDFDAFRTLVGERGEAAGERSGIPWTRIERLAREMAAHRPTVALAGGAPVRSSRGLALALAVSHLNALLGAYREGWSASDEPVAKPPESLAAALERGDALPRVLFVSDTNPAYSLPKALDFVERAKGVDLLVSFSSFPDETTALAHVVLPESMSFERFEDSPAAVPGQDFIGLASPLLVRPLYDTRSMPDALIEIAKRAGLAEQFPWESYEVALRERYAGLGTSWDDAVSAGGFFSLEPPRSGKSDFNYRFALDGLDSENGRDELTLLVYPSNSFGDGRSAHLPYLQELSDPVTGVRWGSVVEIATRTAEARGIRSGDLVELRSEDRAVVAPAFVSEGIHPGAVAIAAGQGHEAYGRYAQGRGVNAYSLFDGSTDEDGFVMSAPGLELRKVNG